MARQKITYADPADRVWLNKLGLGSFRETIGFQGGRVATVNRSSDALEIPASGVGGPSSIFLKRYRYPRWSSRIKQVFRGSLIGKSRARFEFERLGKMRDRGVPAIRPIAYGEHRKAGLLHACYLITEGISEAESLDTFASRGEAASRMSRPQITQLIRQLARVVRQLHKAGVMHGALFWRNILVRQFPGSEWQIHFLDPDRSGSLEAGPLFPEKAAVDMSRFFATAGAFTDDEIAGTDAFRFVSRTNLARFAHAYFDTGKLTAAQKNILRKAISLADLVVAHERHRLAMGSVIKGVRTNIEDARPRKTGIRTDSIDGFLDSLPGLKMPKFGGFRKKRVVHFTFENAPPTNETIEATLTIANSRFSVDRTRHVGTPDLRIKTDAGVWLAILHGHADAFDLIRTNQVGIEGNTTLLAGLARLVGF